MMAKRSEFWPQAAPGPLIIENPFDERGPIK
jgi:hypothetical protein